MSAAIIVPKLGHAADLSLLSNRAFGTTWRLVTAAQTDLAAVGDAIDTLFADIDRVFSPWRSDSVLSRFNALPAAAPLHHGNLARVTSAALHIARASEGAFDPTVGPLVARWGFGPIRHGGTPDWRGIATGPGTVTKSRRDLTLDLCGIAKGWALDKAAQAVEAFGIDSFLLELGGEFVARGQHPDGRDWRLAVATPAGAAGLAIRLRLVGGAAVATSGLWAQGYNLSGRVYSHIIDPATAFPVSGGLRSVTVLAEDAMTADGWATALCAAGAETGPEIARTMNQSALFLIETPAGLRQVETGSLRDFLL